jgi:hypothetical protein
VDAIHVAVGLHQLGPNVLVGARYNFVPARQRGVAGRGYKFETRKINSRWTEVKLPKLGWVKLRLTVAGTRIEDVKSLRVTRDKSGRWFISFPLPRPKVERTVIGVSLGIERGVTNTISTPDGALKSILASSKQQERKCPSAAKCAATPITRTRMQQTSSGAKRGAAHGSNVGGNTVTANGDLGVARSVNHEASKAV